MRNAFADEITKLARENEKVVLLSGDIGNRLFNKYKEVADDRFFNCGIAEANMTSVAAGLALSGFRPVTYTITAFNTIRCLEQIKLDVCYHDVPVIIVGTGSGLSYADLGSTHHSCDDISLLKSIPGIKIVCPADAVEVRLALREALKQDAPVYIRLGKKNEPVIHETEPDFVIGKSIPIVKGEDVCILSTGNILPVVLDAQKLLAKQNISCEVVNFHTVRPLDEAALTAAFDRFKLVVTVEEHYLTGGLGSSIAEWMIDNQIIKTPLLRIGIPDMFLKKAGPQDYARKKVGLTPEAISQKIAGFEKSNSL